MKINGLSEFPPQLRREKSAVNHVLFTLNHGFSRSKWCTSGARKWPAMALAAKPNS
jgi:hypothetical protein